MDEPYLRSRILASTLLLGSSPRPGTLRAAPSGFGRRAIWRHRRALDHYYSLIRQSRAESAS